MEGMMLKNPFYNRPYQCKEREETATAAVERNKRTVSLKPYFEPPIWAGTDLESLYEMRYQQEPWPLPEEAGRCTRTVGLRDSPDYRRELREVFSVPASVLMPGEIDLQELVGEITEMEESRMERSLSERKFKKVMIECEDGRTYGGEVVRITGCPFDYSSMTVEAKISKKEIGAYGIEKVLFQNPATIVYWSDGTKTVVNCMDNAETKEKIVDGKKVTVRRARKCDTYSEEIGLAMAIVKKYFGNEGNYNNVFRKFIPGMAEREKTAKKAQKAVQKAAKKTAAKKTQKTTKKTVEG